MLRLLVLVLLLANSVYFAWSQGYFRMYGFAPAVLHEPQRLQQQIRPDNIRLLSEADLEKALAQNAQPAQPAKECLQAGPFSDKQAVALRKALESALPNGGWELATAPAPAHWVIYMGKYASEELLFKKQAELKALGVKAEPAGTAELQPGLVLAVLDSDAAAQAELARLSTKGIRTARVVQERVAGPAPFLKLPAATESLKAKLAEIKPALAGLSLKACN
jgi:hypothetical protein